MQGRDYKPKLENNIIKQLWQIMWDLRIKSNSDKHYKTLKQKEKEKEKKIHMNMKA